MIPDTPRCSVCREARATSEFTLRRETREQVAASSDRIDGFLQPHFTWVDGAMRAAYMLCLDCHGWVTNLMTLAADSERQPDAVLGLPVALPATELGDGQCDYCRAELPIEAMGLDLLPLVNTNSRDHASGRQQRLCRQCATWWIALLDDPASLRGKQSRAAEGPIGSWVSSDGVDAAAIYLSRRDEYVLRATLEEQGHTLTTIATRALGSLTAGTPVFVTAGKKGRARKLVQVMPQEMRRFVIVVARIDCQEDTAAALLEGAGDFLVSPLSPQQVIGALQRVSRGSASTPHVPSGLPILPAKPQPPGADPGHLLSINVSESTMMTALLARRFLRGYDRVGVNALGDVVAHVFCPQPAAQTVANRLASLIGTGVRVRFSTPPAIIQQAA